MKKRGAIFIVGIILTFSSYIQAEIVSHWTFDEGAGNTAYDSASDQHGTINGATWSEGIIGNCLSFDGNYDYVRISDSDTLDITSNLSIAMWIKTSGPEGDGTQHLFSNQRSISPHDGFSFKITSFGDYDGHLRFSSQESNLYSNRSAATGDWCHVAVTLSGGMARIYIDGQLDNSGYVGSHRINDLDQVIGATYTPWYFFNGKIDDLRIYNHALSEQEITSIIPEPATLSFLTLGVFFAGRRKRN